MFLAPEGVRNNLTLGGTCTYSVFLSTSPSTSSLSLGEPKRLSECCRTEFAEIFGRFGAVAHAVILATVDNASRRRGFIVMARHHDAKVAMEGLNRKDIK